MVSLADFEPVYLRAARTVWYKRVGVIQPPTFERVNLLWIIKTLGVMEDGVLETIGNTNINVMMLSALNEPDAIQLFRDAVNPDGIQYDGSLWELEMLGVDHRPSGSVPIIYTGVSNQ